MASTSTDWMKKAIIDPQFFPINNKGLYLCISIFQNQVVANIRHYLSVEGHKDKIATKAGITLRQKEWSGLLEVSDEASALLGNESAVGEAHWHRLSDTKSEPGMWITVCADGKHIDMGVYYPTVSETALQHSGKNVILNLDEWRQLCKHLHSANIVFAEYNQLTLN